MEGHCAVECAESFSCLGDHFCKLNIKSNFLPFIISSLFPLWLDEVTFSVHCNRNNENSCLKTLKCKAAGKSLLFLLMKLFHIWMHI